MAHTNWSFVRSFAGGLPSYGDLQKAGWNGSMFDMRDPNLDAAIQSARAGGQQYGIWGNPEKDDPRQFVSRMAELSRKYNPALISADIEFSGKGYPGSAGWDYNTQMAADWRRQMPNQRTAVSTMPMQDDFNYGAWNFADFQPQAYGADPTKDLYNPKDVYDRLVKLGVDPKRISAVLGPGHLAQGNKYRGASTLWTADDFQGKQLPQAWMGHPEDTPTGPAPPVSRAGDVQPLREPSASAPKVLDAQNPNAVAYAQKRLGQLVQAGVLGQMPTGDPTAAWRQQSQGIAGIAKKRGYADPRQFLRSGGTGRNDVVARAMASRIPKPAPKPRPKSKGRVGVS